MRDRWHWYRPLITSLDRAWPEDAAVRPSELCQVELGLSLLEEAAPCESAMALCAFMTGYPYLVATQPQAGARAERMVGTARHLLLQYKNRQDWERALEAYAGLPERLRGYDVDPQAATCRRRPVSVAPDRWDVYAKALTRPAPYSRKTLRVAEAGRYRIATRKRAWTVDIPADLPLPPPPAGHGLTGRHHRAPFSVSWDELLETARWMDAEEEARGLRASDWHSRLSRMRFDVPNQTDGHFARADTLSIDGMLHLVGMVSSGKSTLMDVLAVWAARHGLRVTIVVADVIGALRRVTAFRDLGLSAAPILGSSNRQRHIARLHRVAQAGSSVSPLAHADPAFDYLSTACGLDALRRGAAQPFAPGEYPCRNLSPSASDGCAGDDDDDRAEGDDVRGCPLYGGCQQHRAARELVDVSIWITTPAGLVYTRVPGELNPERIRYAELVYRTSDLVIVDEADQVQVQLDLVFSPIQTLVGPQDAWLDNLLSRVDAELKHAGRGQFGEYGVDEWISYCDTARLATNRLYALLRREGRLARWIERDYFTGWTLAEKLAREWSGKVDGSDEARATYNRLLREWDAFFDDPLGARNSDGVHPLSPLARQAVLGRDDLVLRDELRVWLQAQDGVAVPDDAREDAVLRLEFTLVLTVLGDSLERLIRRWRVVERPLNLEGNSPLLFHRPPEDFTPVIPESPMGNVLGFQYVHPPDPSARMGDLRFFRCSGVGRWVLLHLHELFAADGVTGPNVMLLSGTSWAGASPGYHVQVPVGGILRAPDDEVAAIAASTFRFAPMRDGEGRVLTVSGKRGGPRIEALQAMLGQLARRGRLGDTPSQLERERDGLPDGRRRLLLVVGSYEEAQLAYDHLLHVRPDWRGQIRHLVSDDTDFISTWQDDGGAVRRGDVACFADTGAWLLIAPLMAIERGHNILNDKDAAAIGAAYFLIRPHPRPDDISFAVQSINRWAVERARDLVNGAGGGTSADALGRQVRQQAYARWRSLLQLPMVYSTLPSREREAVIWNQMVSVWQVIGRLVRGGSPARVHFCDAAFGRKVATYEGSDDASTSLLVGMRDVLAPYVDGGGADPTITARDRELVTALYGPFYAALVRTQGV
jgi:pPIWI RE three-gene island domain Z